MDEEGISNERKEHSRKVISCYSRRVCIVINRPGEDVAVLKLDGISSEKKKNYSYVAFT